MEVWRDDLPHQKPRGRWVGVCAEDVVHKDLHTLVIQHVLTVTGKGFRFRFKETRNTLYPGDYGSIHYGTDSAAYETALQEGMATLRFTKRRMAEGDEQRAHAHEQAVKSAKIWW